VGGDDARVEWAVTGDDQSCAQTISANAPTGRSTTELIEPPTSRLNLGHLLLSPSPIPGHLPPDNAPRKSPSRSSALTYPWN